MPRVKGVVLCLASLVLATLGGERLISQARPATSAFIDATAQSGLDFVHVNGATGRLLLPEVIGSGGALFDYDGDRDLDLFAVQGGPLESGASGPGSRLYRNDLSTGAPRFTDVTFRSGIAFAGYGMGAATGDIDNDGRVDLFVTSLTASRMFRNNGDGTFADVTSTAGLDDARWSTSATFFDFDGDGWLDLFVTNYVDFRADMKRECFSTASARDYCNPAAYGPVADRLLRNNGDGTFTDASATSRIGRARARGLGVLAADFNGDGWTDLFVANDGDPNQLWMNERGSGAFSDEALLAGVAVNRAGQPQGSMGVDVADFDRDGDDDLFVTNLDNEGHTLYMNLGSGLFEDRTVETGLFSLGFTGFGTRFMDYDGDGWLDLIVANGAVRHLAGLARRGDPYPLRQRKQLFHNDGRGRFRDIAEAAGPVFTSLDVGRGIATGDVDNDGDIDLVVFNNNGPARVLLNQPPPGHWLGVRVIDGRHGRDALGARVELLGRGRAQSRRVQTDGSYLSAGDPRIIFRLGSDASAQAVRVAWPGGHVEEFRGLAADRYWVLSQGTAAR